MKKIVAFIPAHLASVRFPRKVLFEIHGLPMIEHVRRRAILSGAFSEVYVATCDDEVQALIEKHGGKVIRTANTHKNGTSRIAEAVKNVDCSHVVLLQADEPLLLPEDLEFFTNFIKEDKSDTVSWNATGPIESMDELDRHSFVKCFVNEKNRILFCFRRSPAYGKFEDSTKFIRKILGIIGYTKEFLLEISSMNQAPFETAEFIEQMRIIENEFVLRSVSLDHTFPSINEPGEVEEVLQKLRDSVQEGYLKKVLVKMDGT
ncbi:cytidylyltransferase domain-containing protein [Leptospira sp. GIMC2001]|uniref:cytidylyltransferase domain-containing protein n=1 Tax=Leptospira sp. GIMC2001 TaxID=1513297 RepID=UPI00234B3E87|nr:NTP transferase domain-containing protein [Leptospira sp. GIMC2001]WCL51242.1 NTP transferase domain-containing protein [Leptospira sp. GIMC2001]